jgi:hypothetical protein
MLAAFGSVRAWMMTPADILNERPPAPPSTSSALMAREVEEVRNAVRKPTREQIALVYKWADGVSTPTPPGHWNVIAGPHIAAAGFSEVRTARAYALLNMSMHDAAVACWDAKFAYYNPRPSQMDPRIRTIIGLPNFPSYTSGHSTFSAAAAEVPMPRHKRHPQNGLAPRRVPAGRPQLLPGRRQVPTDRIDRALGPACRWPWTRIWSFHDRERRNSPKRPRARRAVHGTEPSLATHFRSASADRRQALREGKRETWPIRVLNLDQRATSRRTRDLGDAGHEAWLTTGGRAADGTRPAARRRPCWC